MDGSHIIQRPLSMALILENVAAEFGLAPADLMSVSRAHRLAHPRQVFCWLAKLTGKWSYPQIGRYIGRDHTTAMHGVHATAARIDTYPELAARVAAISERVGIHHFQNDRKFCQHCGHEVN